MPLLLFVGLSFLALSILCEKGRINSNQHEPTLCIPSPRQEVKNLSDQGIIFQQPNTSDTRRMLDSEPTEAAT